MLDTNLRARLDQIALDAHALRWATRSELPELLDHLADALTAARVVMGDAQFLALTRSLLLRLATERMLLDPSPPSLLSRTPSLAPFTRVGTQATAMADRLLAEIDRLIELMPSTQLESVLLDFSRAYAG